MPIVDLRERLAYQKAADQPGRVVEHFIRLMHRWELGCAQSRRFDPDGLGEIVALYLTPARAGAHGRCHFQTPPEYDPARETVTAVELSGRSATVTTTVAAASPTAGEGCSRYLLKRVEGQWKLDAKRRVAADGSVATVSL